MLLVTVLSCFVLLCLFVRSSALALRSKIFQIPLLKSIACCLAILLLAIAGVNLFAPVRPIENFRIGADSLTVMEADTTAAHLLAESPKYHYDLLHKVSTFTRHSVYREALRQQYERFRISPETARRDIGNFGTGVLAAIDNEYALALQRLGAVTAREFAYRNFCMGDVYLEKGNAENASRHLRAELNIAGGNFRAAYRELLALYKNAGDYASLRGLIDLESPEAAFPDELARQTYLRNGEAFRYLMRVGQTVTHHVHEIGLIAAWLVTLTWFLFLFRIDLFQRTRRHYLIAMCVAGGLLVPAVLVFNDVFDLVSGWSRTGNLLNDLLYCILMIGVPEELAKILPLLIVLALAKRIAEPLEYILFACASALGFAFVENLMYFKQIEDGIIHGRAFLAVVGHMADSSFVAYGIVVGVFRFGDRRRIVTSAVTAFMIACISHGIYDFLLYHGYKTAFVIFFIIVIRLWVGMINNCLNNSPAFSYSAARLTRRVDGFIALSLTFIFALEFSITGFLSSREDANDYLVANSSAALLMIVFFSTTLFDLDLVKGYWRPVTGPGDSPVGKFRSLMRACRSVEWFKGHNYVGLPVQFEEPFSEPVEGTLVERVVLYHDSVADPHWFVLQLSPSADPRPAHVLVKLRSKRDSLHHGNSVSVFFKSVPDEEVFKDEQLQHQAFPFLGWAQMRLVPRS